MRLEERIVTIPQKIIPELQTTKVFFIAEDGKEFDTSKKCEAYEHELKKKNSRVYNTRISEDSNHERLETLDGYTMTLFYISCLDDIKELKSIGVIITYEPTKYTIYKHGDKAKDFKYDITYCDFELYGFGWYMVYWKETEYLYSGNMCFVKNYNNYITTKTKEIEDYNKHIVSIIIGQEKEGDSNNG